jgi:hypothetical protein
MVRGTWVVVESCDERLWNGDLQLAQNRLGFTVSFSFSVAAQLHRLSMVFTEDPTLFEYES